MTHTEPQLPILRNHRVTVSQSQGQQKEEKKGDRETHARYNLIMKMVPNQESKTG
jgi:hypothetical protein